MACMNAMIDLECIAARDCEDNRPLFPRIRFLSFARGDLFL